MWRFVCPHTFYEFVLEGLHFGDLSKQYGVGLEWLWGLGGLGGLLLDGLGVLAR